MKGDIAAAVVDGLEQALHRFSGEEFVLLRVYREDRPIDEIAGGRVYTGEQALELGLVDKIGGLSEAIAFAADKGGLNAGYDVRVVPRTKNFMEMLMGDLSGSKDDGRNV